MYIYMYVHEGLLNIIHLCNSQDSMGIEEAVTKEKSPIILYSNSQAYVVVDCHLLFKISPVDAPIALLATYYIFNCSYDPRLTSVFGFLEKVFMGKMMSTTGTLPTRLYDIISK